MQALVPIDSKKYLVLDGKTLEKKDALLPYDLLITDFCDGAKAVLEACLKDCEAFYFDCEWIKATLYSLPTCDKAFIPKQSYLNKKHFSYMDCVEVLDFLRSPNGCPWDKEQTSHSIRTNIIEEAYELVDAIDLNSVPKMIEETGDLLLQAVFVFLMENARGTFGEQEVYDGLCGKLISRHTHIFGCDRATDGNSALDVWEANKNKEKHFESHTQNLMDVPNGMTALMRAQKVGKRASKAGMDWQDVDGVIAKCLEELAELTFAIQEQGKEEVEKEMGDLLFSIVNLCRFLDVSAEIALTGATNKFIRRFERVEKMLTREGKTFEGCDAAYLDKLWEEAKKGD